MSADTSDGSWASTGVVTAAAPAAAAVARAPAPAPAPSPMDEVVLFQEPMDEVEEDPCTAAATATDPPDVTDESPPPPRHLLLTPDVIRLVALAAGGIDGLHFCLSCKDYYSARPPVRMVIVDNLVNEADDCVARDTHAPMAHIVGVSAFDVRHDPGSLLNPAIVDPAYLKLDSNERFGGLRVTRLGDDAHSCGEAGAAGGAGGCGGQDAAAVEATPAAASDGVKEGLRLRVRVPAIPGQRRAEWWMLHEFLDHAISAVHAAEITHLSLTITRGRGLARHHQRGASLLPSSGEAYGRRFTSLKVLEVVQAELDGVRFTPRLGESAAAITTLIRSTAPTLRTLSLVAPGFAIEHVRPMLMCAGPWLHHLSMLIPDCASFAGDGGLVLAIEGAGGDGSDDDDDMDMFGDMESEMAEMSSDMLRNAADGLCIALLEPARVLAHEPSWGPNVQTRAKALRTCAAALPEARWLA